MTDAERAALREEIQDLTIRQAKARGEVATETLRLLAELGLAAQPFGLAQAVAGTAFPVTIARTPIPLPQNACPVCSRVIGEPATDLEVCSLGIECPAVAARATTPGVRKTNKGHPVGLTAEEMARLRAAPAFDEHGEPIA